MIYMALLADMHHGMDKDMDEDTDDDMGEDTDEEDDDDMMKDDGVVSLYGALRIYDGFDMQYLEESNERVATIFLPMQQESEGFFGYLIMNNGEGMIGALSIYDTEENAAAVNDQAAAFVTEYMAEYLTKWPPDLIVTNAHLGVAALAGLHEGANLIGEMMMDESSE